MLILNIILVLILFISSVISITIFFSVKKVTSKMKLLLYPNPFMPKHLKITQVTYLYLITIFILNLIFTFIYFL